MSDLRPLTFVLVALWTVVPAPAIAAVEDLDTEIRALYRKVRNLEAEGRYGEAIAPARAAVELDQSRTTPGLWWKSEELHRLLAVVEHIATLPREAQDELAAAGLRTQEWIDADGQGRYDLAVEIARDQHTTRRRLLGEKHTYTVTSLHILANSLQNLGRLADAEVLGRRAIVLLSEVKGTRHPSTLAARQNLALVRLDRGQPELAIREFEDVVALSRESLGATHAVHLVAANNLALALIEAEQLDRAESLSKSILPFCVEQGEDSLYTLTTYDNLALIRHARGDLAAAETMLRANLARSEAKHGARHPQTAMKLDHLARCVSERGRLEEALALAKRAHDMRREGLGAEHPQSIESGRLHAELLYALQRFDQARAAAERLAGDFEVARRVATHRHLERSHFDAGTNPLPLLAACFARQGAANEAWKYFESSLARGLWDEVERRRVRPLGPDDQREVLSLAGEIDRLRDTILKARSTVGDPDSDDEGQARLKELELERSRLLARAVELDARLARRYDGVRPGSLTIDAIARTLPAKSALVAWLPAPRIAPLPDDSDSNVNPTELWGLVLLSNGDVHCVPVTLEREGKTWPLLDELRQLLTSEHGTPARGVGLVRRDPSQSRTKRERLRALAKSANQQLLEPLRKQLEAASVESLIVIPTGPAAAVPVEVWSDRYPVTYTPSGSLYAALASRAKSSGTGLLAVGDPIAHAAPDPRRAGLGPLPFSGQEIATIATLVPAENTTVLTGADASEARLSSLASADTLAAYRYIHFATHAVIDDVDPLRSALLLSPTDPHDSLARAVSGRPFFDAWLTAEEIRRSWRLDADLVTLSACETGVGSGAGGLSFAEALLAAGARNLVLSRWRVDDRATALLMHRFYANVESRGLSHGPALREAKTWIRSLSRSEVAKLTRVTDRSSAPAGDATDRPFEHPYYWGAFVLIGR